MQRLLKDMDEIGDTAFAEPESEPQPEETYVTQVPVPTREMAAVLQLRMEELRKEVFYHVQGISSSAEDTIDRLRRYVEFIKNTLLHETEEMVPEIADLRRQGALITFHRKWTIYALEGAMRPDEGDSMDVVAEMVAEQLLANIDRENDALNEPPKPTREPLDPNCNDAMPPDMDDIPGAWTGGMSDPRGNDISNDMSFQMEKMGWLELAAEIAQRGQNDKDDNE